MINNLNNKSAFTLIELLVTITIVSLLFGVVLVNSSALRSTSSDAKRKADLSQLQSALQTYYADQGYYPKSDGSGGLVLSSSNLTSLTSSVGAASPLPSPLKTYIKDVPKDTSAPYCYLAVKNGSDTPVTCDNTDSARCHYYYLGAKLENPNPAMTLPSGLTACSGTTVNYIVTP